MDWEQQFEKWQLSSDLEPSLREQLHTISQDNVLLEDCFHKHLEFGTGGIRAELGPGTNRINVYTIRRASLGLAQYICSEGQDASNRGIVIAYDSRHQSAELALEVAKTVGNHGVKIYLFEELYPTPLLSYAVRFFKAFAGVVITASHNPSEYNGFKAYDETGGQLPLKATETIVRYVSGVADELAVPVSDEENLLNQGLLSYIGTEVLSSYLVELANTRNQLPTVPVDKVRIVYTPLHGTGLKSIQTAFETFGFRKVTYVTEQLTRDGNFPTVASPNPEEQSAFELAIRYGEEVGADILLATDPDADRLGIAARNNDGEFTVLSGNQIGALLLEYLLSQRQQSDMLPPNGIIVKTIVTSELGREIAKGYGVETIDTLTGFKFIGEKMNEFEQSKGYTFQFGFEESNGFLIGDFLREKDAVQAAVFAADMAAYYQSKGMSVYDGLEAIYQKYGYYQEQLQSITLKGFHQAQLIPQLMTAFRMERFQEIAGINVEAIDDYLHAKRWCIEGESALELPKANVLKYFLSDQSWFCIRPSGTEPKVKFYFGVKGESAIDGQMKLSALNDAVMTMVNKILSV